MKNQFAFYMVLGGGKAADNSEDKGDGQFSKKYFEQAKLLIVSKQIDVIEMNRVTEGDKDEEAEYYCAHAVEDGFEDIGEADEARGGADQAHDVNLFFAAVNGELNGVDDNKGAAQNEDKYHPENNLFYKGAYVFQIFSD